MLPTLEELGIGFVPFSPLGKGFPHRCKIDEKTPRSSSDDFPQALFRDSTPEARKVNAGTGRRATPKSLQRKDATPGANRARVDCSRRNRGSSPIPGTTKLHRLEENLGAAAIEFSAEDRREIEDAAAKVEVQGERYSEQSARTIDR